MEPNANQFDQTQPATSSPVQTPKPVTPTEPPAGAPSPTSKRRLNIVKMPYVKDDVTKPWGTPTHPLNNPEMTEGHVLSHHDRQMAMVETADGHRVPMYRSSGRGGKVETKAGNWYPVLGIGDDDWFNKTHGEELAEYYGSDELRTIGEYLDRNLSPHIEKNPDIVGRTDPRDRVTTEFINGQFRNPTTKNRVPDAEEKVRKNIDELTGRLKGTKVFHED
jgi:hypothetical protein